MSAPVHYVITTSGGHLGLYRTAATTAPREQAVAEFLRWAPVTRAQITEVTAQPVTCAVLRRCGREAVTLAERDGRSVPACRRCAEWLTRAEPGD